MWSIRRKCWLSLTLESFWTKKKAAKRSLKLFCEWEQIILMQIAADWWAWHSVVLMELVPCSMSKRFQDCLSRSPFFEAFETHNILPLSQWTCKRPLLPVGDILIHKQKMMVAWVPRQAHKHTHTHTHTQVLVWWGERVWTCCILHSSVLSLLAAALLVSLSIPAYLPVNLDLFSLLRAPAPPPLLSSLLIAIDQSVCSTKFRAGSG